MIEIPNYTESEKKALVDEIEREFDVKEREAFLNVVNLCGIKNKLDFFVNIAYESKFFSTYEENLYYTTVERIEKVFRFRLRKIYGNYNLNWIENNLVRQPEKLANIVYANRMGNGNVASGDGWRYRGMGAIQITGRYNHTHIKKVLGKKCGPLNKLPYSFYSAGIFWIDKKLDLDPLFGNIVRIITGSRRTVVERSLLKEAILEFSPSLEAFING